MIIWMYVVLSLSIFKDVLADVSLIESGGGLKRPGVSLRLTCTCSGFNIDSYWIHWVRQADGKGLEWISEINKGTTYYAISFKGRFTISKDSSRNLVYLDINGLKAEDTAKYYCARDLLRWGIGLDLWGKGTTVTVTSAVPTAPTVFPLSPCNQDIATASLVSIGCFIKGYFPVPATVQWNSGAITSGIENFPPVLLSSDYYSHTSLLTIPASQWQSQTFQCNVEHAATNTRINKRIERSVIRSPVGPEITVFHSSCDSSDGTIQLWCHISGFYPKQLDIDWKVGSRSGILHPYNYPPWQNPGTYTFSTASVVNITQADWLEGNSYYCEATHAASQTKVKGKAKKCKDESSCPSGDIKVDILPPSPKALYIDRNSKISCVVSNLQNEQGLKFTWSREKRGHLTPDAMETTEGSNGDYIVLSRLSIFSPDWDSGETFTCVVEHPSFVSPVTKKISKTTGKRSAPKVYVFPPHQEELNPGQTVSLTCMVNGFFPGSADVQWLENHNPLSEDNSVTTPAVKNKHDDSYFLYSKLPIPRLDWERNTYTCMVIHEALPMKFTQRNISRTQGKK